MDKNKPPRAYRMFRIDMRRLARLYDGCLYAFSQTKERLKDEERTKDEDIFRPTTAPRIGNLDWRRHELALAMETSFPATLRESLLVRIISQTESYLVDIVREIASRDLQPFRDRHREVTMSQAEALSFTTIQQFQRKLVDDECRSLGGKNFSDLRKYFSKKFSIDFGPAPTVVDALEELYARRHLLVHAGGMVDRHYTHKFDRTLRVGQRLLVSEEYFIAAMETVSQFAERLATDVNERYPHPVSVSGLQTVVELVSEYYPQLIAAANRAPETTLVAHWFRAEFRTKDLADYHAVEDAVFRHCDGSFRIVDLVIGMKRISDYVVQWLVVGSKEIVGSYISFLVYLERQGMITDLEKVRLEKRHFADQPGWDRFDLAKPKKMKNAFGTPGAVDDKLPT